MDNIQLFKLIDEATNRINESKYSEALEITNQIRIISNVPDWLRAYFLSGLLIDIGTGINNRELIEEGKMLLENNLTKILSINEIAGTAYYNLGNGYQFSGEEQIYKYPFTKENDLDKAKSYFMAALECRTSDDLTAEILVNLGNCFDSLGRVVEAIECYDQALSHKPNFGMALGNKGKALLFYSGLCGQHQATFILEAYSLLKSAKSEVTPEAAASFLTHLKSIKKMAEKLPLDNPPTFPGYNIEGSRLEKYLINFCLNNRLYLNVCNFCQKCNACVGDTVTIRHMTVPREDKSFLTLSSYLNEIKQDYVTARLLLVLSQSPEINLDMFDKNVTIVDTLDHSRHNIYIQMMKTSFSTFYNILDKLAFFLNDHLKLGVKEENISFSSIWYTDKSRQTIREKILNTKNISLLALYDIHNDLDYGGLRRLKNTRNALTHRFVKIQELPSLENDTIMSEDNLLKRTLELAWLVRSSIIYLLQFINIEEMKKSKLLRGKTVQIKAFPIPDNLKNRKVPKS